MDELDYVKAFARDRQQHADGAKLSQPDTWMLATYAFDLQRKQNYLYMADRMRAWWKGGSGEIPEGWPATPRDLLNVILNHNEWVKNANLYFRGSDWEVRARMLERIIRHQARLIYPDTEWILSGIFGIENQDLGEGLTHGDLPDLPDMEDYVGGGDDADTPASSQA